MKHGTRNALEWNPRARLSCRNSMGTAHGATNEHPEPIAPLHASCSSVNRCARFSRSLDENEKHKSDLVGISIRTVTSCGARTSYYAVKVETGMLD